MTTQPRTLVPAVGGEHLVPSPDPIARDYILLALRLDQHVPGVVEAYVGPAVLKAEVDMGQRRSPSRLAEDALALRERVDREVVEPDRRRWLDAQLVALQAQAHALAVDGITYLDLVSSYFEIQPSPRSESEFRAAAADLERLIPGHGVLAERIAAWERSFVVPSDRIVDVVDWLLEVFRERARKLFGVPEDESLSINLVAGQPWGAYNWYDGGFRSRIDINTDLPTRAQDLPRLIAHEAYPGHHLEQVWKETELVHANGRTEHTIMVLNTPECLISEGLAELGVRFAIPPETEEELLAELFARAALTVAPDPVALKEETERAVTIGRARRRVAAADKNAILMRHVDGASHEEVEAYLRDVALMAPDRAAKRLTFIEHPTWRTYALVYTEGEDLLRRWLELVPSVEWPARFGRLLREPLTPSAVAAEIVASQPG